MVVTVAMDHYLWGSSNNNNNKSGHFCSAVFRRIHFYYGDYIHWVPSAALVGRLHQGTLQTLGFMAPALRRAGHSSAINKL